MSRVESFDTVSRECEATGGTLFKAVCDQPILPPKHPRCMS